MPRKVIHTQEVVKLAGAKVIPNPFSAAIESEKGEEVVSTLNDRIKNLRESAAQIHRKSQISEETLLAQAKEEAAKIVEEAVKRGNSLIESKITEADAIRDELDAKAARIISDAEAQARDIIEKAKGDSEHTSAQAREDGYQEGIVKGLERGEADIVSINEQLHTMLNKVIERRNDMIDELEDQLVTIIMMMVQKIVKAISEQHKATVVHNIVHSLRKLKRQVDIIIRVNISNKKIADANKEKILKLNPHIERVTIVEDTSVDPGGCIVETDYGKIDARIRTQLEELERHMQNIHSIRVEK